MYHSEIHLEPFEGLPDEALWPAIEDLHQRQRQRAAAFRRCCASINRLEEEYLQDLQNLLGEEKWAVYSKLREQTSLNAQRMFAEGPEPPESLEKLTETQVNAVREAARFLDQMQDDLGAVRKLQDKYAGLMSKASLRHRRGGGQGQVDREPGVPRGKIIHLYSPFAASEYDYEEDPRSWSSTKWSEGDYGMDVTLGNLKHWSLINLYDAGDSSHRTVQQHLGFAAVVEPPSGWTGMRVMAQYVNNHSCATWAHWDECGTSGYRQEFTCEGYLRVHEFLPFEYPLLGKASGLELRGTNQGSTGHLVLGSNGTIARIPPVHAFWEAGETVETAWLNVEGPSHARWLAIHCGLDCRHHVYGNDTSLYSDVLFDLKLQYIKVQFGTEPG
jgi:hypothetical protein